jgi:hypothetical protein
LFSQQLATSRAANSSTYFPAKRREQQLLTISVKSLRAIINYHPNRFLKKCPRATSTRDEISFRAFQEGVGVVVVV